MEQNQWLENKIIMSLYVISDIHGCSDTFISLLDKIGLNKTDSLYLLGDYIDRGNNSSGVLETIFKLKAENYNVFPLKGNHEEHILNAEKEYDLPTFIHFVKKINKSGDLLNENGTLISKYRSFFESLPYYYVIDDYILVHAGLNLTLTNPFEDLISMVDLRGFNELKHNKVVGNRKIIHGHVPIAIDEIIAKLEQKSQIIPLDNGCVYTKKHKIYDYTKLGNLLCLELNNLKLTIQKNVD